jgi:hypothetical protein
VFGWFVKTNSLLNAYDELVTALVSLGNSVLGEFTRESNSSLDRGSLKSPSCCSGELSGLGGDTFELSL